MAKTMSSPTVYLGKRRGPEFSDAALSSSADLAAAFDQSFKKIRIRGQESPILSDGCDPENSCPQAGLPRNGSFPGPSSKARREEGEEARAMQSSQQYLEQQIKFMECQLTSLRAEHQVELAKKSAQATELSAETLRLRAELQRIKSEREASLQEAKILKKAVAIQDARLKEQASQQAQMESCLRMAYEKLQEYDQIYKELLLEVAQLRQQRSQQPSFADVDEFGDYGDSFPPNPPPDVF